MFQISKEAKDKLDRMAYLKYRFDKEIYTEEDCEESNTLLEEFKEEYEPFIRLLIATGVLCVELEKEHIENIKIPWQRIAFNIKNCYDNGQYIYLQKTIIHF